MHRIDNSKAITPMPVAGAVGPNPDQFFQDTAPTGGTPVDPDWLNAVQEELCNVIEGAGLTLSKTDNDQLLNAMLSMVSPTNIVFVGFEEYDGEEGDLIVSGNTEKIFTLSLFTEEAGMPAYDSTEVVGVWVQCSITIGSSATETTVQVKYRYPGQATNSTIMQVSRQASEAREDLLMFFLPVNAGATEVIIETVQADSGTTEATVVGVSQRGA